MVVAQRPWIAARWQRAVRSAAVVVDQLAVDAGLRVVVEVLQGGWGRQAGEAQPAGQAAGFGGLDLGVQQPFQRRGQREVLGAGGSSTAGRA
jgi:hypothetical protein